MKPKISFIIPVYNAVPHLMDCINNLFQLNLSVDYFEIIFIDDCSSDNTISIIEEFQKNYSNIILFRHESNRRQGAARNTGIKHARGMYCMFVDVDDKLLDFNLPEWVKYMQYNNLELLIGKAICINNSGEKSYWANKKEESAIVTGPQFFRDEWINMVAFGTVWIGIYKTELLKRTEPFVENMIYEDTDWCYRCMYNAKRVQYKPVDIYLYYNNPTSSSHNVSVEKLEWKVRLGLRIYNWSQKVDEEREWVKISAEDFYTWNLRSLSYLLKFSTKERRIFYSKFTPEEYSIMRSWPTRYKRMKLIQYPLMSQIVLFFISPVYKFLREIKRYCLKSMSK